LQIANGQFNELQQSANNHNPNCGARQNHEVDHVTHDTVIMAWFGVWDDDEAAWDKKYGKKDPDQVFQL